MLHWQTFTRQSHFQSVLSLKPWAARSLSETMFWSDKVHRGGKRSAKWHSRARCRFQEKPHISPPQNNSSLSRLESSLLTTEPCKSSTPSLTAMTVGCSLDYVAVIICSLHELFCRTGWWDKPVTATEASELDIKKHTCLYVSVFSMS